MTTGTRKIGKILTLGNGGFTVYKDGRFHVQVAADATDTRPHAEQVAMIARHYFGRDTGARLRRVTSTELPTPTFAAYGWTRETRATGSVSITVDHYEVIAAV